MKRDGLSNSQNSDAAHPTGRHAPSSECAFLESQAADAKAALIRTLYGMKATTAMVADLRPYIRPHPWLIGVSALAVGCVAGAIMGVVRRHKGTLSNMKAPANGRSAYPGRQTGASKKSLVFAMIGPLLAAIVQTVAARSMTETAYPAVARDETFTGGDAPRSR